MKCSRCGHRSRSLAAMAKHCRKKHPGSMKRKTARKAQGNAPTGTKFKYCPHCGGAL